MKTRKILSLALVLVLMLAVPAAAAGTAAPTQYAAAVNGGTVTFPAYEVDGQVYVRLRDAAKTLNAFDVKWVDDSITITTGVSYTSSVGTEMAAPFSGNQTYAATPGAVTVNGAAADLKGILLTDGDGNGYSYFTPQALEAALGVSLPAASMSWSAAYAEKVRELSQNDPELTYALIYVDGDDVPELVADMNGYFVKLFTYVDGQLKEVFDLGYGIAGNAGYMYIPGENVIYSSNTEYGEGYAVTYETFRQISPNGELEDVFDKQLAVWRSDAMDGDTTIYHYGTDAITEEQYDAYNIEGDYEMIEGSMTADETLAALAG